MQTTVKDGKFKRDDGTVIALCSGLCPVCGSEAICYDGHEFSGDFISFPFVCEDCGAVGNEYHELVFTHSEAKPVGK